MLFQKRGSHEQDCINRARETARYRSQEAISQCASQARYFHYCEITQTRVLMPPQRLLPVEASGNIDDRSIDERGCKSSAQNLAIQNAIHQCQNKFNVSCRLIGGVSEASYRIERRRRYVVMGPKDDYHICQAQASAVPDSNLQVQCSVETIAKVRL